MTGGSNGTALPDPGLQYLYSTSKGSKASSSTAGHQQQHEPVLVMAPLPRDPTEPGNSRDWGAAVGNVETAKLALDTLRGLIADAVFLDEDAYTNAATLQHYHQRLQVGTSWACQQLMIPQHGVDAFMPAGTTMACGPIACVWLPYVDCISW